jgi:hypothetical protein
MKMSSSILTVDLPEMLKDYKGFGSYVVRVAKRVRIKPE